MRLFRLRRATSVPTEPAPHAALAKLTARERVLRVVELMPELPSVTLPRDLLLEALRGAEPTPSEPQPSTSGDRLLTANQVAEVLGCSPRWVYDNADSLPFTRRIKPGMLRFSEKGLQRYLSMTHRP